MSDDTKALVGAMVDRFLCWKLPEDFCPDCGINFTKFHPNGTTRFEPIGTNLLTADQARAMLEHIVGDTIERLSRDRDALAAENARLREALEGCRPLLDVVIKTVDAWERDPQVPMAHPFAGRVKVAKEALLALAAPKEDA